MYDIGVSIDDLESIVREIRSLDYMLEDSSSALGQVVNDRCYDIWMGEAADEYWEMVGEQRKLIQKNQTQLSDLAKKIEWFIDELRQAEEDAGSLIDML